MRNDFKHKIIFIICFGAKQTSQVKNDNVYKVSEL